MNSTTTLREAKRLYSLGFAIHWLREKSKIPVEAGWTTGGRKTWDYLKETYYEGLNVGVRLGQPSKLAEGYLCVIDVDIKSTEKHHRIEAIRAVKALLGAVSIDLFPAVRSGRGNGSRHYYCVTPEPFKTWNPAASSETVKVRMPSKKPSKRETHELKPEEIADGWRLAPAWELSLYSDGRQVVLPPSVHPDSGELYTWVRHIHGEKSLPAMTFVKPEALDESSKTTRLNSQGVKAPHVVLQDFEAVEVELDWLPIPEHILKGIKDGDGVRDRSGYLLPACSALVSAGLSRNEVLSVLTDTGHYLGACAFDHARTTSRAKAAEWVWKYTAERVFSERSGVLAFKDVPVLEETVLSDSAVAQQTLELMEDVETPEDRGFYFRGAKGALRPDYGGLMSAFACAHPFKTVADMKAVYTFDGTHYIDCTPIEIRSFAEKKFSPKPEEKLRTEFYSKVLANNVTRRSFFTESTEGKINFKNGVLDLNVSDSKLLPHSADYGFRGVLPYEFDEFATARVFKHWIEELMQGDQELVSILQEFMGYVVRGGDYKYHKALWLGGVGRNGKSTFVDLLKALIGVGNFSVISIKALMNDKFAGADLDGKIANFSEETSPQELADSGPFKNLTGDGDLFAQKKYGDPYSFRNRAKLIMTYNQIPDLKDLSPGMLSRPMIIPFLKVIEEGEQDRGIKKKLFAELPGIFNFALDGWRRLEAQEGFTKSEKSETALKRLKEESCNAYQWIENHVEFLPDAPNRLNARIEDEGSYRPKDLYSMYCRNERYQYKSVEFYRRINSHPGIRDRKRESRAGNFYYGLRIRN